MSPLALTDSRGSLRWSELSEAISQAARALHAAAYNGARRVGVLAPNANETVLTYLAGLHAGVSSVPINFHLTAREVAYILRDSGSRVLFVGPETVGTGLEAAQLAGVKEVIGWRCDAAPGLTHWEAWVRTGEGDVPRNLSPMPYLHYTSGTTGTPKATLTPPAMFPRVATVGALLEALRLEAAAVPAGPLLVAGPLYHTGPLQAVKRLAGGVPLVVMERFDAESALRLIAMHQVASTVMVPTHFERLLALPDEIRHKYDVKSLRSLAHTGAACPARTKLAMIEWFGPVLLEAYGGTESGTTNLITSQEWLQRPGSVGRCVPGYEPLVLGSENEPLPPGTVGRLFFRDLSGRGIEYEGDAEKTAAAHVAPAVFTLGEVGYVDGDGYVFITDRAADMIVSGGVNIYPAEAEHVLMRHAGVADAAVIGVPHGEMGEAVKALIVPRDPAHPPPVEELDGFCRAGIAGYKCPRSYEFVQDLGRNALGKVNKRQLRQPYWQSDRTIGG